MSDDSYFRPEVPVTVPDDLRALLNHPPLVKLRVGPGEGCQPPMLHTYRREFGERCQCGEREWPAELRDDEPSAAPDG